MGAVTRGKASRALSVRLNGMAIRKFWRVGNHPSTWGSRKSGLPWMNDRVVLKNLAISSFPSLFLEHAIGVDRFVRVFEEGWFWTKFGVISRSLFWRTHSSISDSLKRKSHPTQ